MTASGKQPNTAKQTKSVGITWLVGSVLVYSLYMWYNSLGGIDMLHISGHAKHQAQIRQLVSELNEGLIKINSTRLPSDVTGEINFIIERKSQILHREGSTGDLVIIGVDWTHKIVKTIMLQNTRQVESRRNKLGKQYCSLLHK